MGIVQLPPVLANQIAAGEVVERPASVVKELLENAIDAGAHSVRIDVEGGGTALIRVRDDGGGIASDELALALARHATSKVRSFDDLTQVRTLGFRGEALPSIASVARVCLTSRQPGQDNAWTLEVDGVSITDESPRPANAPAGTTVEVRELFFNTPARRRFLRTPRTEYLHVETVVRRIALAHPELDLVLARDGRNTLVARAAIEDGGLRRMSDICGRQFAEIAIPFEAQTDTMRCYGWVAPAAEARASTDLQYACVNGRVVRDPLLRHALRAAFDDTVSEGRQPAYVVYLELPVTDVDVNVHPTKHEVRFGDARTVHDFVWSTVRRALRADGLSPDGFASEGVGIQGEHHGDYGGVAGPGGLLGPTSTTNDEGERVTVYGGAGERLERPADLSMADPPPRQNGDCENSELDGGGARPGRMSWGSRYNSRVADGELDTYVRLATAAGEQRSAQGGAKRQPSVSSSLVRVTARYALYRADGALDGDDESPWVLVDGAALMSLAVEQALSAGDEVSIPLLIPAACQIATAQLEANESFLDNLGQLGFAVRRSAPDEVALLEVPACLRHLEHNILWDCLVNSWGAAPPAVVAALAQVAAQALSGVDDAAMQRWLDRQATMGLWPNHAVRPLSDSALATLFGRAASHGKRLLVTPHADGHVHPHGRECSDSCEPTEADGQEAPH